VLVGVLGVLEQALTLARRLVASLMAGSGRRTMRVVGLAVLTALVGL
jgi:hypothetical protein